MTTPLDVLVIESHPGAAAAATAALEAAGHRATTCHPAGAEAAFPCRAVIDPADCPLDDRPDVALLVRKPNGHAEPSPREQGAGCAIRDGVPVVEAGSPALDPYEPWLADRVQGHGDVVAACEAARTAALGALRTRILTLVRPRLAAARITMADVTCRIEPRGMGLHVDFDIVGAVPRGLRQVLAVRTLDAVRGGRRPYEHVSVSVNRAG